MHWPTHDKMKHFSIIQLISFVFELLLTLFTLAWFANAYPDKYRTTLWTAGGEHGWNSNPKMRIYYYANYEEPPDIPLIWSQRYSYGLSILPRILTESNLAISSLAVLVCLARGILLYRISLRKFINPIYDLLLCGFWTYSVRAQSSSDLSEKDHWSIRPWYLERSCTDVEGDARDACVFAKVSYSFAFLWM
ncbi:hypothetical protein F4810DRAFT_43243 [Camillea tinctor]|nr:hypothetical protein F4810DRAFT_43243 [Camillea tinctor]